MELFKERLKEIGMNILFFSVLLICAGLIAWGLLSIPQSVAFVLAAIVYCIFFLGLILFLVSQVWKFIKWLFIEPFRKEKR